MTASDYLVRCSAIHRELATIAERTRVMSRANCANPSNPDWAPLMDRKMRCSQSLRAWILRRLDPTRLERKDIWNFMINIVGNTRTAN